MIHRLRRKFIFINMSMIMFLMTCVVAAVWLSSYHHLQMESQDALHHALTENKKHPFSKVEPPQEKQETRRLPSPLAAFAVEVSPDNSYEIVHESAANPSDDLIQSAILSVKAEKKAEGSLSSLSLRYMTRQNGEKLRIAFLDTSFGTASMRNLSITCFLVLAAGALILFAISYFLSRWALRPVENAWNQQQQFIADASHELKTPLTVILANLRILLAHKQDTISSQERWMKSTQTEAERMKKLVEELLFLARSDAGSDSSVQSCQNLSDLVWNMLLLFEPVAYENGITLQETVTPGLTVLANPEQLKRLLAILLDNACKYAGGEKQVALTLCRQKEYACLTLKNTGTQIPPKELSHLFERFYRPDKSRSKEGYGLGLPIAQAIVQGHGGKIMVESTEEATCFTVLLPLT